MLDLEVRCSVAVFRDDSVLLVHRTRPRLDDWVLPGGSPLPGEGLGACARRELSEETGLEAMLEGCGLLVEALDPHVGERILDIVFVAADPADGSEPSSREPGLQVGFVSLASIDGLRMRPALGAYLQRLRSDRGSWGSYLDDVHPWDMALDLGESGLLDRP